MKKDVKIKPAGGPVNLQLVFGFASGGAIFDSNDQNGNTFQKGVSTDPSADLVCVRGAPASLVGRTLLIDADVVSLHPPDMVCLSAQVFQDGAAIPGASLESKALVQTGQKAEPMLFFRFTF